MSLNNINGLVPSFGVPPKWQVLVAGIFSLMLTIGVARFSYTPLLPVMLDQTVLDYAVGGWLATAIYLGYMTGVAVGSVVTSMTTKDRLYRVGLVLAVVTTAVMPLTENIWVWALSRYLAGLSGAAGIIFASSLILHWLMRHEMRTELGVHFAGVGLGIAVLAAVTELMTRTLDVSWAGQWVWLTVLSTLLFVPAWVWMPQPDTSGHTISGVKLQDRPPSRLFMQVFLLAYMCAGAGYVVSATFTVEIVEQLPGMQGQGVMAFLVMGLAAAPACVVWDRIARRFGYMPILAVAFALHIPAVIIPLFSSNLWLVLLSTALFGACFMGTISMVLAMAGLYYPTRPAKMMGQLTIAYGFSQTMVPLVLGFLAKRQGGYEVGLIIAATLMVLGTALVLVMIGLEKKEAESTPAGSS